MSSQAASSNFNGWVSPSLGWIFWLKVSGDLLMKCFLGVFHISILSTALGEFGTEFGDLTGAIGDAFEAMGMGSWNLGTIISLALTLVFLATPPAAWYLYETSYEPDFWRKPSPSRLILISIIALYSALLCVELSILFQNISAAAAIEQSTNPFALLDESKPPSPYIQASLALLMTILGIVMGWVTSKLLQHAEVNNLLFNQGRN